MLCRTPRQYSDRLGGMAQDLGWYRAVVLSRICGWNSFALDEFPLPSSFPTDDHRLKREGRLVLETVQRLRKTPDVHPSPWPSP